MTKPFSARELLLRINAILKRGNRDMKQEPATVGAITVDPSGRSVSVYGKPIKQRDRQLSARKCAGFHQHA